MTQPAEIAVTSLFPEQVVELAITALVAHADGVSTAMVAAKRANLSAESPVRDVLIAPLADPKVVDATVTDFNVRSNPNRC